MDLGIKGKVALVAGASKGLGKAVALGLAREGVNVAILSRDPERIQQAAQDIARLVPYVAVLPIAANVMHLSDIERAVEEAGQWFGNIDILVTNAGGPPPGSFTNLSDAAWQDAVNLTLLSAVRLSHAVLRFMQPYKWGRIIHICSYTVKHPVDNLLLSNCIRSAVVALGKSQATELGRDGILVNSVLPGWTETERVDQLLQDRARRGNITPREAYAAIEATIPVARMGRPEEFANAVVFLASERASYINGVCLLVDGGITPTPF